MLRRLFFELFYLRRPPWDTGITPPELEEFVQFHLAGRALDLGCGTGTNAVYLAQHGWQVIAVDFAESAIRSARKKARQAGVQVDFHLEDATRLKGIDGPFDLILDIGCFHSLMAVGKVAYVQNLQRLLASGGIFLLYAFVQEAEGYNSRVSPEDLKRLGAGLRLIKRQDGMDRDRPSAWLTYQRCRVLPSGTTLQR